MIFGHEGLPRSGKSAEAMTIIVDALRAGRVVVTNIAGINHKAFSDYLAIPLDTVKRLLQVIEPPEGMAEEQVVPYVKQAFLDRAHKDCLWIWDEINQFWPPDRQPLHPDWAKFVTEHGHKGIDILIMGQDLTELHKTWRGRLQRYTRFTKLDMMGKENEYHWASMTNIGRNKFKQTAAGKKPYNKEFWGFYKSHDDGTTNKGNIKDQRFSVFQTKHKVWGGIFAALLFGACYQVWGFFNPDLPADTKPASVSSASSAAQPAKPSNQLVAAPAATTTRVEYAPQPKAEEQRKPVDYLDRFAMEYQVRLSGYLDRAEPQPGKPAFDFVLEFVDTAYRVKERMNRQAVAALGWDMERTGYGLRLTKGDIEVIARPWPLDNFGKVPQTTIASLKPGA